MKTHIKLIMTVLFFGLFQQLIQGQQTGLSWMNIFGSKGNDHSPGFIYHQTGYYILAIGFDQALCLPGTNDTIWPKGQSDGLLIKVDDNGQIIDKWQLMNKGHLTITAIVQSDQNIAVAGSFQDSLFLHSNNGPQFLLNTQNYLSPFIIELTTDGTVIQAMNPYEDARYASTNYLWQSESALAAASFATIDSSNVLYNFIDLFHISGNKQIQLQSNTTHTVLGTCSFGDKTVFFGAFNDTLILGNDSLIAKAGKDAYFGLADQDGSIGFLGSFGSLQHAEAIAAASFENLLWVGVNFSDTLYLPNADTLVSVGSNDCLIAAFNDSLDLVHKIHIQGVFAERVDKLFVQDNKLYIFTNVASPVISGFVNETLNTQIEQDNVLGNAALFELDQNLQLNFLWMAQHDWTTKITGLRKAGPDETIIAGLFTEQLTIDSILYTSAGNADAFLLKISDQCISTMKSSLHYVSFCPGDSIFIPHLNVDQEGNFVYTSGYSGGLYIFEPTSISLQTTLDCGCNASDSIIFMHTDPANSELSATQNKSVLFLPNTKIQLSLKYCGDCSLNEHFTLSASPNPFLKQTNVSISLPQDGKVSFSVMRMDGTIITQQTEMKLNAGMHFYPVNLDHLPAGTYMLHVFYSYGSVSGIKTMKLINQ